ncbi:hypothetical protein SAMN04487989_10226 [Bizionia echini]|uniref:Lipoprotein n=1 Tax=Bizionia echini TaxID=649333 RepID=A0A1I5AG38_9FLAO|nr:hypothetical protein [Bizionia echini]SFN61388.1 hypothetical protein SAMN04487989_10226 [Bizionia echini]
MRLIFISIAVILCSLTSCKRDNKLPEYNIEEFQKKEYDSVKKLLSLSRTFYEKEDYENAILNLEDLISRYATYDETLEAQKLLETSKIRLIIIKINEATNIKTILILIENNINPEISIAASIKIEELIKNAEDINELEDYVNQNKVKEHNTLANNKISELKEKEKQEAYASAIESESSNQWKKFLEDYPDHPKKNDIEKIIIALEVTEIFDGEYGEIPASELLGSRNNSQSVMDIKNDTKYTLTLRYSGPDIKKISIPPNQTKTIHLKSGVYKVAASVSASNVRNFAGTESLYGEYSSSYYISTLTY